MSEERPKVNDHLMILRCGVRIWNRWRKANLGTRPNLVNADLGGANLGGANLQNANLQDANLQNANLVSANLENINLENANLGSAYLGNSNLANAYLGNADLGSAYLGNADLGRADLRNAYLGSAYLGSAYLGRANLERANLGAAKFVNANLEDAYLRHADLQHADLRDANLGSADLWGANLGFADLGNTDLGGAKLFGTLFDSSDLRKVKGLEKAEHKSRSPVSSQTLKKSQGQVPEVFLKGCGLEDWEILSAKLHDPNLRPDQVTDIGYQVIAMRASSPIVPFSLFISYCHKDQRFVDRLGTRFDEARIRYWRDVHDLNAGPIDAQVDSAIGLQRATVLVLSGDSVNSDWVEHEARRARRIERKRREDGEGKYFLCPIALDDTWKTCEWPERLRDQIEKYTVLDFSRWGSAEEFDKQFERLKTGLRIYYAGDGEPGAPGVD